MAYALVGSVGAVSQGSSGAAVTPAWGTGESRTANNLLILWVDGQGSATLPSAPANWSIGIQKAGTSCSASVFYKVAAGGDAAPTVGAVTSTVLTAQLAEFSGNATSSPLDKTGTAAGTTSTQVATAGAADTAGGELVVYATGALYSLAATKTLSNSLNNGATAHNTTNNSTSTVNHYDLGYGITTGNSAADADTFSFTTQRITGAVVALASFKLAPSPVTVIPGVLNLTSTEFAPTTKVGTTVRPGVLALTTSTFAPTVKTPQTVIPGVLNTALSSFAPSVRVGIKVQPALATLTLSEFAPTVLAPRLATPGLEALTLTGFAPSVGIGVRVTADLATFALATFAPTVTATGSNTALGFEPRQIHELRERIQARARSAQRKTATLLYTQGLISTKEFIALLK